MFYNDTRKQMKMLANKIMSGNGHRNIFVIIAKLRLGPVSIVSFSAGVTQWHGSGIFFRQSVM